MGLTVAQTMTVGIEPKSSYRSHLEWLYLLTT
ncbi:hypothetical protein EPr2_0044 [Providencia phage EPr2]|uniref:Uncharacterized protein n=1 Tax=Providencia phage EPr2 TaxID=2917333 RepID=A0AC61TT25_9CAUD|nr:hypothetical protein EPr2_0044 [Providencia phage EPr2]